MTRTLQVDEYDRDHPTIAAVRLALSTHVRYAPKTCGIEDG
jgi:hypothetical protein